MEELDGIGWGSNEFGPPFSKEIGRALLQGKEMQGKEIGRALLQGKTVAPNRTGVIRGMNFRISSKV